MELVAFIQVFNIIVIVIAIGTLLYMCCRSFSSSSPAADSDVPDSAADSTAVKDDDDADNPPRREKYDVFISFRGEDTRRAFTSHLHAALLEKKITTYIDDKLKRGDEIAPALLDAIKESELSVIIFSKDYASSTWCLDELVHILECKEKHGQLVIPIFYDTLPSDVRKQCGSYEVAFAQLEQRFQNSIDKVHKWRDALTNAANISGFDSKNYGTDADLVKKVVEDIWTKLCRASSCDLKGFVGIESRIEQVESLLGIHPDACITVGIWGMGGIGKTTLAEAVFRRHSSKFEASSFLKNVRENSEQASGLDNLEKTLLKEILKEEGLSIGSTYVRQRLRRTKVLIVLDDVSDSMQLERLAGNPLWFGTGSRIIITTRDRGTLGQTVQEDNIYEVELLKPNDALELFCSRAFKNNSTRRTDYKESAEKVVHYARGVPLALTVIGSLFFNCKSKEDWEDEFNKLKRFPNVDIQKVLRISYDRLGENEKEILLDIACFHKGESVVKVKQMLDGRGFFVPSGIRILIEMSLISIDSKGGRETIEMHDLLQEMGRKIVQEQGIKDPGKRSRLFNDEDVYRVLKSSTETPNVEAIKVNRYKREYRSLKHADFKKMSNLIMLSLVGRLTTSLDLPDSLRYLEWSKYELESLPSNFCLENLVELHMPHSKVKKLWKEEQILVNLQVIHLEWCTDLTEVPNLSGSLKIVEINLMGCSSLVEIPSYFQHLDKLTHLDLGHTGLKYLPEMPRNIRYLDLQCNGIKELPKSVWSNENISYLDISRCFNQDSCTSHGEFSKLPCDKSELSLANCKIRWSPSLNICKLKYLSQLTFFECIELGHISERFKLEEHLRSLHLSGKVVKELHSSELLPELKRLELQGCKGLSSIPKSICKLKCLKELNLSWCSSLQHFPEILEPMEHLESLILSGTAVKELHSSIELLPVLKRLGLRCCKWLSSIPKSICKLKCLEKLDLSGCSTLQHFPEILEPMEHLKSLILSGTAVKELHSSIELLPVLERLELEDCKGLSSIPNSICKLKCLKELNLSRCSTLQHFSEILESLILSGTVVKELHSSIELLPVLERLELKGCKWLSSIPKSICKLKCLKKLDLSWCSTLQHFPEILEPMEHLKSLILSGTAVKELHSSIELLPVLERLKLQGCKWLSSIPKSICKLKCLEELDLSCCDTLQHFPEILEPMEHLESLILSGTTIKEVHSSIELLPVLKRLELQSCKGLSSIPKSICKLKCLEELNLSCCDTLQHFPEIVEPMEHLESLILSGTTIKEVHSSIELLPVLKRLELQGCKRLSSIPKSICKLKCLEELDLSCCDTLQHFPEILEPMEHLESLILSGTTIKEVHSSIELLPVLKRLELQGCKRLSSIPKSICKLKCLKELNLSGCSTLQHFPEILEPMEHLESLILSGTAVKELHSSIELFPVLERFELQGCKGLSSIPKSICKLKCLKKLDLSWCSTLQHFPEILEPMEHLKSLILSGTAVKELHSSIELLPVLERLKLQGCKWLLSIPKSICKLKCLEELDLSCCSTLQHFPEILEPIEHLKSLILSGTAVKELHSSIELLPLLERLELQCCKGLSSIPKSICKLKCLEKLDLTCCSTLQYFPEILEPMEHLKSLILSGTAVKELHSSIELLPVLERLKLQGCKWLSSIPKSICKLKCLEELDLSCCDTLQHFPEILEPMEHLESLILSGTTIKEVHSSIELLPVLKRLELQSCKGLSSIPKSICKLKCLEELNLSCCDTLQHFPEIVEPMEHLESLILSGTTIKEVHSSIELLPVLKRLELQSCKGLSSIPKSICKLKCLEKLDLTCCSTLQYFPEILEPMEHLKSLILSGTAVKELHSSIELLPVLERLELQGCKRLSSIPKSICKLKCLEELDLSCCDTLQHFPEILEPMEHLESLILSGTTIKEVHSSIELLPVLKRLELQGCKRLSSIPKSICKLKCLEELDLSCCDTLQHFPEILEPMEHLESLILSGTTIKEVHSSIELLPVLKRLELQGCKGLSSIPKSICKLKCIKVLDLSCCSTLQHFPEILEPMEHLESLNLSGTKVEQLYTSSIQFLPALKNIELEGCDMLSCISKSMLKYVNRPDLEQVESSDESEANESEQVESSDES